MRLIDADALKELLYYDKATCAVIDEVPTIDPVKRGAWIHVHCSECWDFWAEEDVEMVNTFCFCPNCGAKMK